MSNHSLAMELWNEFNTDRSSEYECIIFAKAKNHNQRIRLHKIVSFPVYSLFVYFILVSTSHQSTKATEKKIFREKNGEKTIWNWIKYTKIRMTSNNTIGLLVRFGFVMETQGTGNVREYFYIFFLSLARSLAWFFNSWLLLW